MSAKVIPLQEWVKTFHRAADEFARASLRFDPKAGPAAPAEAGEPGAYITILSPHNSVHLGLSASPARCRQLARALLGLRSDESLSEADMVDGMSEVMNIIAGKVKASMAGKDGQLSLGLPMFVQAPIRASAGLEAAEMDAKIGPVDCKLRVYRRQRAA